MKKILLIEDDLGISSSLKLYLENSNFLVDFEVDWNNALKKIEDFAPDLIILDLNLPGKDGIEITKEYRKTWKTPIIMLTARSSEIDRVSGLENWADDYIAKPFSPRELLARINTILRRLNTEWTEDCENSINFLDIEIDQSKKIVKQNSKKVELTSIEYEILEKLMKEKWNIVSREAIMKEIIWYDNYVYDRTIDTHIKNLRKKLWKEKYILTIRWVWYRINV